MNGENDATRPGVSGTAQERPAPPELGELCIQRTADGWDVYRDGRRIVAGLSKEGMLQLIRGERTVRELLEANGGHR